MSSQSNMKLGGWMGPERHPSRYLSMPVSLVHQERIDCHMGVHIYPSSPNSLNECDALGFTVNMCVDFSSSNWLPFLSGEVSAVIFTRCF